MHHQHNTPSLLVPALLWLGFLGGILLITAGLRHAGIGGLPISMSATTILLLWILREQWMGALSEAWQILVSAYGRGDCASATIHNANTVARTYFLENVGVLRPSNKAIWIFLAVTATFISTDVLFRATAFAMDHIGEVSSATFPRFAAEFCTLFMIYAIYALLIFLDRRQKTRGTANRKDALLRLFGTDAAARAFATTSRESLGKQKAGFSPYFFSPLVPTAVIRMVLYLMGTILVGGPVIGLFNLWVWKHLGTYGYLISHVGILIAVTVLSLLVDLLIALSVASWKGFRVDGLYYPLLVLLADIEKYMSVAEILKDHRPDHQ
ncbi:hypothetical protein JKG47_01685 [Acidithiobacillus sp. MC6.1]|nr:hypothetical protein [Acidithiobacillus sp. MC6.1]